MSGATQLATPVVLFHVGRSRGSAPDLCPTIQPLAPRRRGQGCSKVVSMKPSNRGSTVTPLLPYYPDGPAKGKKAKQWNYG